MVCVCVCVHALFICVGVHACGYSCMARGTCWVLSPSTSYLILWDKVSYWTLSSLNWLAHPEDLPISLPGTGVIGTLLGTTFYTSAGDRTKSHDCVLCSSPMEISSQSRDIPTETYWQILKLLSPSSYFPHRLFLPLNFFFGFFNIKLW